MARLPYANINEPAASAISKRVAEQRGKVLHLYGMLLHSPAIAEGWLQFLTAIRQKSSLAGDLRELVIMRIAELNGAKYEADQHTPYALKEGLSKQQLATLSEWQSSQCFDSKQKNILALTDAMTKSVEVPQSVFDAVKTTVDDKTMVELTATIAAYNMVSRFLVAMEIAGSDPFEGYK